MNNQTERPELKPKSSLGETLRRLPKGWKSVIDSRFALLLEELHIPDHWLAREVDVAHSTIFRIRQCEMKPSQPLAVDICEVLGKRCGFPLSVEDLWPYPLQPRRKGAAKRVSSKATTSAAMALLMSVLLIACAHKPVQFDTEPGEAVVVYQIDDQDAARTAVEVARAFAAQGWHYSLSTADDLGNGGMWVIHRPGNEKAHAVATALNADGLVFRTLLRNDAAADVQVWVGARER